MTNDKQRELTMCDYDTEDMRVVTSTSQNITVNAGPVYVAALIIGLSIIIHGCMTAPRGKTQDVRVKMVPDNVTYNN